MNHEPVKAGVSERVRVTLMSTVAPVLDRITIPAVVLEEPVLLTAPVLLLPVLVNPVRMPAETGMLVPKAVLLRPTLS